MCLHIEKNLSLQLVLCKECDQLFLLCGCCRNQGYCFCSNMCRKESRKKAHRRNQSKYRTSLKGREANKQAERRRRIQNRQKTMADRGSKINVTPPIVLPNPFIEEPTCSICGAFGRIIAISPLQTPIPNLGPLEFDADP